MNITIDEDAIKRLAREPGGGIALAVEETAQAFVEDAQRTLSVPQVYSGFVTVMKGGVFRRVGRAFPNPPPGPPRRRTGDLQRSIRWTRGGLDPAAVYVISDAATSSNYHDNVNYSALLRSQGYKFLSFELPENLVIGE